MFRLLGRKLYLDWGGNLKNLVVAIEKLPGERDRIFSTIPYQPNNIRTLLVDVCEYFGEKVERPIAGARYSVPLGREFQHYLIDDAYWITREEEDVMRKFIT